MTSYTTDIVNTLTFEEAQVTELAFCPRGKKLAIRFPSGNIYIYDMDTADKIVLPGHRDALEFGRLAFTPDGTHLLSGHGYTNIAIYDLSRPQHPTRILRFEEMLNDFVLTRDGATIVTAAGNVVSTWDFATGALKRRYVEEVLDQRARAQFNVILAVDDAGNQILFIRRIAMGLLEASEGLARSGELEVVFGYQPDGARPICMHLMPDKEHFLSGSINGWIHLWNIDAGSAIRAFDTGRPVYSINLMPNHATLLLSGRKQDGAYWKNIWTQSANGEAQGALLLDGEDVDIVRMATSPDCSLIATSGRHSNVVIRRVSVVEMKAAKRGGLTAAPLK